MGWVKDAIKALNDTGTCQIRPHGGSMRGKIESGQLVTLERFADQPLVLEDAIFIRWKGNYLLHLVKEINGDSLLIGNNLGKINGWITRKDVLAIVTKVED